MKDYDELVQALRCCEFCNVCDFAKHDRDMDSHECIFGARNQSDMLLIAADAIEKLIKMIIKWQEYCYDSDERIIELEKAIAKLKAQIHPSEKTLDILEMIEEVK